MDPDIIHRFQDGPCHSDKTSVPIETPIFNTECLDYKELEPYENDSEKEVDPLCLNNSDFIQFVSVNKYKVSTKPMKYEIINPDTIMRDKYHNKLISVPLRDKYHNKSDRKEKANSRTVADWEMKSSLEIIQTGSFSLSTGPNTLEMAEPIGPKTSKIFPAHVENSTLSTWPVHPSLGQEKEEISVDNDNLFSTQIEKVDAINSNSFYYRCNCKNNKSTRWARRNSKWTCNVCKNCFMTLMLFIEHWNAAHKEETMIICMNDINKKNKLKFVKIKETDLEIPMPNSNIIKSNNSKSASNKSLNVMIEEKYTCPLCSKSFAVLKDMIKHIDTHKNSQKFNCSVCNIFLKSENALNEHMQVHENPVKKRKEAHQAKDYRKHEFDKCDPINGISFSCSLCKVNFVDTIIFIEHLRNVHKLDNPISCPICDEEFRGSTYGSLALHMWDHSSGKIVLKRDKYIRYIDSNNKISEYYVFEQSHKRGKHELSYLKSLKNWYEKHKQL